jgi:YHS domain-containing protein
MLRFLVYSLVAIFLITLIRAFIGMISRGLSELFAPQAGTHAETRRQDIPAGGELRKDPVCGTYVPESSAVKLSVGGQTVYFCSEACRDKYRKA